MINEIIVQWIYNYNNYYVSHKMLINAINNHSHTSTVYEVSNIYRLEYNRKSYNIRTNNYINYCNSYYHKNLINNNYI